MRNAAWKFFMVDFVRSKQQIKLIWLFVGISLFMGISQPERAYFAASYLIFGAIIFSTTPFALTMKQECGFLNMLPGTLRERVAGRFLYTSVMVLGASAISTLIVAIFYYVFHKGSRMHWDYIVLMLGVALIMCSLQNVVLYLAGRNRHQQMISLLRLIPGMLFFFGSLTFLDAMDEAWEILRWIVSHMQLFALGVLAVGIVASIVGILVSEQILARRDYA